LLQCNRSQPTFREIGEMAEKPTLFSDFGDAASGPTGKFGALPHLRFFRIVSTAIDTPTGAKKSKGRHAAGPIRD